MNGLPEGYVINYPSTTFDSISLAQLAEVSPAIEPHCRDVLLACKRCAQALGHVDYAVPKLAYEGLTVEELYATFRAWRDQHMPAWQRTWHTVVATHGTDLRADIVPRVLPLFQPELRAVFDQNALLAFLARLLARLGGDLTALPITVENRPMPYSGAVYRLEGGSDIRVVVNANLQGYYRYFFLLHEFGHAIYYCHCPRSELLLDSHLSREIMADLWTQFLGSEPVLRELLGVPEATARSVVAAYLEYQSARLLLYMRDSMFMLELIRDPSASFAAVWRHVTREWLGVEDEHGAFETFDFLHPLDMKSYVIAQSLSRRTFQRWHERLSDPAGVGTIMPEMIAQLYRPGSSVDWKDKFNF